MEMQENVSLRAHSTMRLGGAARYLAEVHNRNELQQGLEFARANNVPVLMIGSGSNIVWKDEGFGGLVLVNRMQQFDILRQDASDLYLTIGAGEDWDSVVARTVSLGFSGIEQLSLIPGTAGATPVQNVGAYGREIAEVLVSVEAFDSQEQRLVTLPPEQCGFGYRTSRFKTTDRGRFYITSITLHLSRTNPMPPFYSSLQSYLDEHSIHQYTPQIIRDAVIAIRRSKLPDPAQVANNGSFFANPIVTSEQLAQLRAGHPQIVYWPTADGRYKLSAAWLIDNVGFKDIHDEETGMSTWPAQSLVLINERATDTAALLRFKQKIVDAVYSSFAVTLEQEPELLP